MNRWICTLILVNMLILMGSERLLATNSERERKQVTTSPVTAVIDVEAAPEYPPAWLDTGLYPFENRHINVAGNRIHYVDEGTGPILLFLHPDPAWSFIYRNIIIDLRDRFRCIAFDYPGFGLSQAAETFGYSPEEHSRIVEGFIQALDLSEVTMMVHSQSGPIGLAAAGRLPERFKALIICNTFGWPLDEYPQVKLMLGFMGTGPAGFLFTNFNIMLRYMLGDKADRVNRAWTEAEKAAYHGPFLERSSRLAMHLMMRGIGGPGIMNDVAEALAKLSDLPLLNLWSDGDLDQIPEWSTRWENAFPNHRTVIISNAKHFHQEDNPRAIVTAIRDWWQAEMDR